MIRLRNTAIYGLLVLMLISALPARLEAAINPMINYQGRLVNGSGVSVSNGLYNMRFKLYTTLSGGSPIFTETLSGADRIGVASGLFSVMIGSSTPITGVDFDQTLYLGVEIGGTDAVTPTWDGEMAPRKTIGSVPSAFVAKNLDGGYATTTNLMVTASTTLQDFTAINSTTTSGTSTNLFATTASTTNFYGAGLTICQSGNVLTYNGTGKFGCAADATGSGSAFSFTPTAWGVSTSTTIGFLNGFLSTASSTINSTLRLPTLSAGGLGVDSTGLVYSGATTTAGTGLTYSGNAFSIDQTFSPVWTGAHIFNNITRSTSTSATSTNFFATTASSSNLFGAALTAGSISGAGLSTCNNNVDKLLWINGLFSCGTDQNTGSGGSDVNWTFFNTSGLRLGTSTNQVLVSASGATATSSLAKLEVRFDSAANGSFLVTGSSTLQNFTFVNATGTLATSTNFFAATASTTNFFATNGNIGNLTVGSCTGCGSSLAPNSKFATSSGAYLSLTPNGGVNTGLGIGTTTPAWALQIASSTAPQLTLSDPGVITNLHWSFRNAGGNFYLATSSATTYATSTYTALAISGTTGNIGIGIAAPSNKLQIETAGNNGGIDLLQSGTNIAQFINGGGAGQIQLYTGGSAKVNLTAGGDSTFSNGVVIGNQTGSLGIGVSITPDRKLDVLDTSPQARLSYADGTVYTDLQTTSGGAFTILPTSGFVSIGTSTPQWLLQLATSTRPQLTLSDPAVATNLHWSFRNAGGNFYLATSSASTFATSSTPAISILTGGLAGRVGINTATPLTASVFNVSANGSSANSTNAVFMLGTTALTSPSANGTYIGTNALSGFTGNFLDYQLNTTREFSIDSTGSITTLGGSTAILSGTALTLYQPNATVTMGNSGDTGTGANLIIEAGAGGINSNLDFVTDNVTRARLSNAGFGIGTTTQNWLLQLASSTKPQLTLSDPSVATNNHWSFRNAGGNFYLATSSPTTFATSSMSAFIIDANGKVGIGSTTPTERLSVDGSIFSSSNISASNILAGKILTSTGDGTLSALISSSGTVSSVSNIAFALAFQPTFASTITTLGVGAWISPSTAASGFTMATLQGLRITEGTKGAGSAITTQQGIYIGQQTNGSDNYSIYSDGGKSYFKDYIGMGTTTPQWMLQLSTSTRAQLTLSDPAVATNNHWSFRNAGGLFYLATSSASTYATSTTPALTINASGFVGIGNATPQAPLDVTGPTRISKDSSTYLSITPGSSIVYDSIASTQVFRVASVNTFSLDTSFVKFFISGNEQGRFDPGGFGVGTTTPVWALQIASSTKPQLTLSDPSVATFNHWSFRNAGGLFYLATSSASTFATSTTAALSIDANAKVLASSGISTLGNLGVGTANPASSSGVDRFINISGANPGIVFTDTDQGDWEMFVQDYLAFWIPGGTTYPLRMTQSGDVALGGAGGGLNNQHFTISGTTGAAVFSPGGTEVARIIQGGYVGVGTSTPNWLLQLASSTKPQLTLSDGSLTSNHWSFRNASGTLYLATSSPTTFSTSTMSALTINGNGFIGIGTTTPGAAMDIIGALCVDDGTPTCQNAARTAGTIYSVAALSATLDLAESYPTKDPTLRAGEIVMLDSSNEVYVSRATTGSAAPLLGIVSTQPGFWLGGFNDDFYKNDIKLPIALSGHVPTKVNNEGGEIHIGDKIALSSVSGVGKKATSTDQTVGIALQGMTQTSGTIEVFVNLAAPTKSADMVALENRMSAVELNLANASGALTISTSTEQSTVSLLLEAIGATLKDAVLYIKSLVVDNLTVGKPEKPSGITLYDTETGAPYCMRISGGVPSTTPGDCSGISNSPSPTPTPTPEPTPEPQATSTPDSVSETATSTSTSTASAI